MSRTQEKKLDLITRLLAKAESTSPEEAEALTEHAERLMIKYGIEQAKLDDRRARSGEDGEQIVQRTVEFTGVYARSLLDLGAVVVVALGQLRPLQATSATLTRLYIVGFESDAEQAEVLVRSLHVQALVALRSWWAANRHEWADVGESEKRRVREGFLRGFGAGAAQRIHASREAVVAEGGTGTEIVLADRQRLVDAHVEARGLAAGRRRKSPHAGAFSSGHRAGQRANTGSRAVSARPEQD